MKKLSKEKVEQEIIDRAEKFFDALEKEYGTEIYYNIDYISHKFITVYRGKKKK